MKCTATKRYSRKLSLGAPYFQSEEFSSELSREIEYLTKEEFLAEIDKLAAQVKSLTVRDAEKHSEILKITAAKGEPAQVEDKSR